MKTLALIMLLVGLLVAPMSPQCATVAITLGSDPVAQGQTQTIATQVTNCGPTKKKLRTTVTATDSIGNTTLLRNSAQFYEPSESVTFNDTYEIIGPTGTYRIISIVFVTEQGQTTEIARDTREFQVVP
jgi:hypothetical protein